MQIVYDIYDFAIFLKKLMKVRLHQHDFNIFLILIAFFLSYVNITVKLNVEASSYKRSFFKSIRLDVLIHDGVHSGNCKMGYFLA